MAAAPLPPAAAPWQQGGGFPSSGQQGGFPPLGPSGWQGKFPGGGPMPPMPPSVPHVNVQKLAEDPSLTSVPSQFVRPLQERPSDAGDGAPADELLQIPVIDISKEPLENVVKEVEQAAREWGFFQIVGHGVPESLVKRTRKVCWEFYNLPLEKKQEYAMEKQGPGEGYGQQFVVSENQVLDWGDVLSLRYPASGKWPSEPSEFREAVGEYCEQIRKCAGKLLDILSLSLGLPEDYLQSAYGEPTQPVRVNFYPPCPQPDLVLGLSAHSDSSGITLLLQDDEVPGLQVRKEGKWVEVQPIKNALVINLGDQLEVMSNGNYKSIEHRAVANSHKARLSIATFYNPNMLATVQPAPKLVGEGNQALYKEYKFLDYIMRMMSSKLEGKKMIDSIKL